MPAAREVSTPNVAEIHAAHADFVWRSLQRLGVRESDLEDALQEVFLVVHRKLTTFQGTSRLTTWLFGISVRVAAAHRSRAHVRRERTATAEGELEPAAHDAASTARDPEQALLDHEARSELEALLDGLTPVKRATIVMFEIEGMSAPEIATLTDVPVATVYSRIAAARAELVAAAARARRRSNRSSRA